MEKRYPNDEERNRRNIGKRYRDIFEQIAAENREFVEKSKNLTLMDPECTMGYTEEQVTRIMGARLYDFRRWMEGQTEAICDGREWNYETNEYEPTGCGPHGFITYRQDVERFLLGLPVVD